MTCASSAICANYRGDDLKDHLYELEENGFSLIEGVLDLEMSQKLIAAVESILDSDESEDIVYDPANFPIKIRYPLPKDPLFISALKNEKLIALVDSLFPRGDAILTWEDVLVKQPNSNTEVLTHQDLALQTTQGNVYSIGLSLHDDSHNPVHFLPQSHKAGPLTRVEINILDKIAKPFFRAVEAHAGDALVHDVNCVHHSGPLNTNLPRYTWYLEFRSEEDLRAHGPWDDQWINSRKKIWGHIKDDSQKIAVDELKVRHVTPYLAYDQTSPHNHFVNWSDEWKQARPHRDGTHHSTISGNPIYDQRFDAVLPFHHPGLAPVNMGADWFFILPNGKRAFEHSFDRAFGFYCGHAAVVDDQTWYHIQPNGLPSYDSRWSWCGNFQQHLCVVRDEKGGYHHINSFGELIRGGPHSYAGDFREGFAVIRGMDGLCRHITREGHYLHNSTFLDLDVFHKGFARARDSEGWHHIDTDGFDVSGGVRYSEIEPFYNGQALARGNTGEYVVIDENGSALAFPVRSDADIDCFLQSNAISYWQPIAIRLGILCGLAGGVPVMSISNEDLKVLEQSWIELGLITENRKLTFLGEKLKPDLKWRDRFLYWTGPQMDAWVESEDRLLNPDNRTDFFAEHANNRSTMKLIHRVLDSYAKEDWSEIRSVLNLASDDIVVDLGGGRGALLEAIGPTVSARILVERPEVIGDLKIEGITMSPCNIFSEQLPLGDVYILSRILHDWDDQKCLKLLRRIPKSSTLIVIDRLGEPSRNGLLSLNMLLLTGGRERSLEEWDELLMVSGWKKMNERDWLNHSVMFLEGAEI